MLSMAPHRGFQGNPPTGGFFPLGHRLSGHGFTLVELIVVMLVISILAAVSLPRFSGNAAFSERAFRDNLVAGLRYAQKSAIAARRTTCAAFANSPASVTFSRAAFGAPDCSAGVSLEGPDGNALVVAAGSGVSFAALPGAVVFDASGRPVSGASITISGLSASQIITIEAETGYVH